MAAKNIGRILIGKRLFRIRKELGLTLQGMAGRFNQTEPLELTTTFQDVWKYENAVTSIPAEKYEKFLVIGGE